MWETNLEPDVSAGADGELAERRDAAAACLSASRSLPDSADSETVLPQSPADRSG